MSSTYFTRKRGQPVEISPAEQERLAALTQARIEAEARHDPDNPPLEDEQLRRMALARAVRLAREKTGLSQSQFAAQFRISLGRLRDYEQARYAPDFVVMVYLKLIAEDPEQAKRLVQALDRDGLAA
jgi:putative transcriptional regulator